MEEADAFIKEACKHLECSFSDDDEIEFSTPQVFEFLVRCIWKVDSSSKTVIPSFVHPKNVAARLQLGKTISDYLQKLQIRGDTAYHTVLYGNINNLRSAFIELIRKLPSDTQEAVDEDRRQEFFAKTLGILNSEPKWVPVYCRGLQETKHHWVPPDNSLEIFPLITSNRSVQHDPRHWIAQFVNSNTQGQPSVVKSAKPALPPKPVFATKKEQSVQEKVDESQVQLKAEVNESDLLKQKYEQKLQEYRQLQDNLSETNRKCEELRKKLLEYDPELIDALQDPEFYAEHFLNKIADLNKQMENDVAEMEERKKKAAQRELELSAELKEMGLREEEFRRMEEIKAALENIDEKIEANHVLAAKLERKLAGANEDRFAEFEKRSNDLDEMVRKQEDDMIKMQEERMVLRKQEERENEAVNRSFAIIYNILLQHCDHYRGRLAMESFTRIHLYCMEIMEMLRDNGTLKQAVGCLQEEIGLEEQKDYDKQYELLKQDYQEISDLNDKLLAQIKAKDPSFEMPKM